MAQMSRPPISPQQMPPTIHQISSHEESPSQQPSLPLQYHERRSLKYHLPHMFEAIAPPHRYDRHHSRHHTQYSLPLSCYFVASSPHLAHHSLRSPPKMTEKTSLLPTYSSETKDSPPTPETLNTTDESFCSKNVRHQHCQESLPPPPLPTVECAGHFDWLMLLYRAMQHRVWIGQIGMLIGLVHCLDCRE